MKKNIMILLTKLSNGGAEKAATILAENLSKKYNVYLVVYDNSIQDYETNVKIIDLHTKITNKNYIKKIINVFKRIWLVKKYKKQLNIDVTISLLTTPNLINVLTKGKDKTIVSIRNNLKRKKWIEDKVNSFAMKKADKIVTVSKEMRDFYITHNKINKNKIVAINNICKLSEINEKIKNNEILKYNEIFNGNVIISLGRHIKQKGQWHLIRAFSKIAKENKEYKLVIFGRGKKKEYLQNLINSLSLNEQVYLLDFVKNPYIYLKKSKFLVTASLFEGCSNTILEAMACGIPVIATDCDYGNREILAPNFLNKEKVKEYKKEEFGILVPEQDEKYYDVKEPLTKEEIELYKAIKELIENEELRKHYQEKSMERIQDFQENVDKWIECIEETNN